jgi:ABC-type Zn uptake system ZnuABC Zn-binding protein ZnuA
MRRCPTPVRLLALVTLMVCAITSSWRTTPAAVSAQEPAATPAAVAFPPLSPLPEATPRAEGALKVITTIPLLADLTRQIGGSRVDVQSVLPPNADAHEFEPKPQDLVAAEDAALIVEHGLHLDDWAADLVANAGSNAPVVVATMGVQTIASDEKGFDQGDPHVWFDPRNVKVMVDNIAAALVQVDANGLATYEARRDAYKEQLDQLDQAIMEQIATIPPERRKLVTNHDAFGYFAARYGLTYIGSVIPSLDTRAEPSAKETAALIEKIKAEGVPAIFTEVSVNPALEEELAKEAGVKVISNLYGDTLGEPGSGADTYIGMMQTDTRLIVEGLR